MNVLLVNPWIYDFAAFDLWAKPLGLLYIAGALQKLGCSVHLIDCLDRNHPGLAEIKSNKWGCGKYYKEEVEKPPVLRHIPRKYKRYGIPVSLFEKQLENENPDLILVSSGMTYWYPGVFKAIEILKKRFVDVPILLGGIYATLCTEHAKRYSGVEVFPGGDIAKIIEKIFSVAGRRMNKEGYNLENAALRKLFDSLYPAYELYSKLDYVAIRTSLGCPFRCSYCATGLLSDTFVQKNPDKVVDEIEYFCKNLAIKNVAFYDDALLFNAENHIGEILTGIIRRKINCYFHTPNGLQARYINERIASLMHRANFICPRLSLETTNVMRQRETGNKVTNEEFKTAVKNLYNAGYKTGEVGAYVMMGMPGQDFKEVEDSIKFVSDLGAKVFLVEYSPIPGTKDWQEYKFNFRDPLFHNNSIFPLYDIEDWGKFQKLKDFTCQRNESNNQ